MDTVICRCEEVLEREIVEAIRRGLRTTNEIKKATRAGMGLCQGKICAKLIERIIGRETGQPPETIQPPTVRPPVRPLPLGIFKEHPAGPIVFPPKKRRQS